MTCNNILYKKIYNEKHEYTPLVGDRGVTRNVNSLNPIEYEFPNLTKEYWYMFMNDKKKIQWQPEKLLLL